MATYDPSIIHQHADALYQHANRIIRDFTMSGAVLGIVLGIGAGGMAGRGTGAVVGAAVLGAICAVIGRNAGRARAFRIKLEAQTALCQAAIEENTRRLLQAR